MCGRGPDSQGLKGINQPQDLLPSCELPALVGGALPPWEKEGETRLADNHSLALEKQFLKRAGLDRSSLAKSSCPLMGEAPKFCFSKSRKRRIENNGLLQCLNGPFPWVVAIPYTTSQCCCVVFISPDATGRGKKKVALHMPPLQQED